MTRKNIILTTVLVIAAGIIAYILYNAFMADPELATTDLVASPAVGRILPAGNSLDFSLLQQYNKQEQKFPYPEVTNDQVSLPIQNLIK